MSKRPIFNQAHLFSSSPKDLSSIGFEINSSSIFKIGSNEVVFRRISIDYIVYLAAGCLQIPAITDKSFRLLIYWKEIKNKKVYVCD